MNLSENGRPMSFELRADVDGESTLHSRFVSSDSTLLHLLASSAGTEGKLRVTIDGVPYIGRLAGVDPSETRQ